MRLDIIGSVASGKTTLAKRISEKYEIPYYEKDNIVWERTAYGDKKRTPEDRDNIYRAIIESDNWIVEGSPRKVLKESFAVCDHIILLDVNIVVRLFRVFRRWIRQKIGKERYNSTPTIRFLFYNIKWVIEFDQNRRSIISELSAYKNKFKKFRNADEVLRFLEEQ